MPRFRLPQARGNVRGLKKEEEDKVSLFYSEPGIHALIFFGYVKFEIENKMTVVETLSVRLSDTLAVNRGIIL